MSATTRIASDRDQVCRRLRRQLGAGRQAEPGTELRCHLESCASCAVFARRLELARRELGRPLLPGWALEPDPGFPARLLARIGRPADVLGWAAFRALPAALGLALALAWLGLSAAPAAPPTTASASGLAAVAEDVNPSPDQLMAWSAAPPEVLP
jgi:hypothetical protein